MKALIARAAPPHAAGETWRPALVRLLLLAHYALFGLVIGVQGVGWSDVKQRIGLGDGAFGLAFVVTPLMAFVLLLFGRVIWCPFGRRQRAVAGLLVIAGALSLLAPAADLAALVLSRLLAGLGFSLLDAAVHETTLDWEEATGGQLLSLLYAAFSSGAILGALAAGALLQLGWSAGETIAALVPACVASAALTALCTYPPARPSEAVPAAAPARLSQANRPFLALAALCLAGVCAEVIGGLWSTIDVRARGGDALASSSALALFNAALIGGRLLNGTMVDRWGARTALRWSGFSLASAAALLTLDGVVVSIAAYALAGLGVAGVFPTALSSVRQLPGVHGSATSQLVAMGYLGAVLAPSLAGGLAEVLGLRLALPLVLGAVAVALGALSGAIVLRDEQTPM